MNNKKMPVAIIGAGGHAKVLLDSLKLANRKVITLVEKEVVGNEKIFGVPIIAESDFISQYSKGDVLLVNGIGSVKSLENRQRVYNFYRNLGYSFSSVIHPSAIVSEKCVLSDDVQIMAGVIIQAGCRVNENVIVNTGVIIEHDCQIGAHVHISPGCVLSGNVIIGRETHMGTGSVVIQGINIGRQVLVAAGAVVVRNIPDKTFAKGVPAKSCCVKG